MVDESGLDRSTPANVIYKEDPIPGGTRTLVSAIAGSALLGGFVLAAGAYTPIAMFCFAVFLIALPLLSINRYYQIEIDSEQLRVGRVALPLTSIDRQHGVKLGTDVLDDRTLSSLEIGWSSRRGELNILGGGFGRPMNGSKWIMLQEVDGQRHVVATRDPERFTISLLSALA